MSSDLNTIEYTITDFDVADKVVRVTFDDGGRAVIPLMAPLPASAGELDKIIRQFTAPKEVMQAREEAVDLSYISDLKGAPRQAERFSIRAALEHPVEPQPEPETLEEWKAVKLAEIANWRWVRETGGVTFNGLQIDTDRESQATITGALVSMQGGLLESIEWKTKTGAFVTLDLAAVQAVAQVVAAHVQLSFSLEKQLVALVDVAQTIEDVQAIVPETIFEV